MGFSVRRPVRQLGETTSWHNLVDPDIKFPRRKAYAWKTAWGDISIKEHHPEIRESGSWASTRIPNALLYINLKFNRITGECQGTKFVAKHASWSENTKICHIKFFAIRSLSSISIMFFELLSLFSWIISMLNLHDHDLMFVRRWRALCATESINYSAWPFAISVKD